MSTSSFDCSQRIFSASLTIFEWFMKTRLANALYQPSTELFYRGTPPITCSITGDQIETSFDQFLRILSTFKIIQE